MAEVPTRDDLLRAARKACDDANLPWWDDEARAILDAVLPLVAAPAVEALKPFSDTANWLKPDLPDDFDTTKVLGLPLGDCRLARTTHAGLKALGEG